ncbi:hypothetical protein CYLTODRAFT_455796 [Cylindrobasidium torrendii FP15055 ss-10]|uniref:Uncharacterized protein n=1 Tax=Cylindrobasidium torrendii FP15055 ss-10 TaxID=1314674 RepID=A0A0D7B746_9AGAR|nr:hypothetical protein CYLTODRAFT_455796 [Cylindrobasidium torrendii FP15055 ss-10]
MNDFAGTPLPMNSTATHPKLKVSLSFLDRFFIAGDNVCGSLEMECRSGEPGSGKELGIGAMMIEMWGVEELLSRDHSAKAPFLYCRRLFQGPGLPASNAVYAHPLPNMQPMPTHYHLGKRGQSSFNFRMPIPATSPSSISFCQAARVRYEIRASVQIFWKGEKKVVVQSKEVDVIESYADIDFSRDEPESVAVGENGKIWMQGKVVGGVLVAGESACVELQVKNHSSRKNVALTLSLERTLHVAHAPDTLLISDTLTTVPFRGPEYIIPPGAEGVASLVFDVPRSARTVRGGRLEGLEERGAKGTEALFDIGGVVTVKMGMGLGRSDIVVTMPVTIVHPAVLPDPPEEDYPQEYWDPQSQAPFDPYMAAQMQAAQFTGPLSPYSPTPAPYALPISPHPGAYAPPMSPQPPHPSTSPPLAYVDPNQNYVWFPPPNQYFSPPPQAQAYYYPQQYEQPPVQPVSPLVSGLPSPSLPSASNIPAPAPVPAQVSVPAEVPPPTSPSTPLRIDLQNLAPQTFSPTLHSPRPFLSPKLSPSSNDGSLGRSERVEALERMADEVPMNEAPVAIDKTLPGPPVPTGKSSSTRPRADMYFAEAKQSTPLATTPHASRRPSPHVSPLPSPKVSPLPSPRVNPLPSPIIPLAVSPKPTPPPEEKSVEALLAEPPTEDVLAPKTPTLSGISRLAATRKPALGVPTSSPSGLDALEQRLLADVGTRKVRAAPPPSVVTLGFTEISAKAIDIPSPKSKDSKGDESAISSLSLGAEEEEKEWDERTHRGKSVKAESDVTKSEGQRKSGQRNEQSKRKIEQAKGRVAAWLGGVSGLPAGDDDEGEAAAVSLTSPSPAAKVEDLPVEIPVTNGKDEDEEPDIEELLKKEETTDGTPQPDPRSSGFKPMGTFKRDALTRTLVPKDVTNPWADAPAGAPKTDAPAPTNPWKAHKSPNAKSPNLPNFPPLSPGDGVKYDIRSARGGRGGKVTSVAALWANGALGGGGSGEKGPRTSMPGAPRKTAPMNPRTSLPASPRVSAPTSPVLKSSTPRPASKPTSPAPRLKPLKSSTPGLSTAVVSSSHATPVLSSTVSLARPVPTNGANKWRPGMKTLAEGARAKETKGVMGNANEGVVRPVVGDVGKTKIKDLIKKYQQQTQAS